MKPGTGWLWLLAAGGLIAALLALQRRFPWVLEDTDNFYRLLILLLWLLVAGGGALYWILSRPAQAVRDALIWLGLFLTLILGYSYRDLLSDAQRRVSAELVPGGGVEQPGGSISFAAGPDGHFYVDAVVEGTPVRFLVDTGATLVVLSPADARRIGFGAGELAFTASAETANGTVRFAPVSLRNVELGPFRLTDVAAAVNEADMDRSLLGVSFLSRLGGYDVRGDRLTLHP
jgi:aspartyl protease family protein